MSWSDIMKRNYGIDLLRMLLMLMVLILHVLGGGGILDAATPLSRNYNAAWLLETLSYCAVDCYVIITGYVHMGNRYRLSSYVLLWLQVLTYSLGIAACLWLIKPETFSLRALVYFLTPVSHNLFWFFSAYTGLYVLIPFLNRAVLGLSEKQSVQFLLPAVAVLTLVSIFSYTDPFALKGGYSVIWFIVLYLIGACIRQHQWTQKIGTGKAILIYFLCVLFSWGEKLFRDWRIIQAGGTASPAGTFISYVSPTILIAAITLFYIFCNLRLNDTVCRLVKIFSPAAFGVYLIHCHECVNAQLISKKYVPLAQWNTLAMVGGVLGFALAIFVVCLLIDWVRGRVFALLKVKQRLEGIEQKIIAKHSRL